MGADDMGKVSMNGDDAVTPPPITEGDAMKPPPAVNGGSTCAMEFPLIGEEIMPALPILKFRISFTGFAKVSVGILPALPL
mmetsp:Transcript_111060/g.175052  ORF Transcript_111060/g.175052 Transcript_111060/m.175052 type:complete len:81 (-) Transcript_111060:11-253(-)